jgi:hypothetical protein
MYNVERFSQKDPSDVDQFAFDFTKRLSTGETLTAGIITATPSGLTLSSSQLTATAVATWVSGGTNGVTYTLFADVTTSKDIVLQRSTAVAVIKR